MLGGDLTCIDQGALIEVLPSRQIESTNLESLQHALGVVTKKRLPFECHLSESVMPILPNTSPAEDVMHFAGSGSSSLYIFLDQATCMVFWIKGETKHDP